MESEKTDSSYNETDSDLGSEVDLTEEERQMLAELDEADLEELQRMDKQ